MAIKKARGVTSSKGVPTRREGQNGDITMRRTSAGRKLFVKDIGDWYPFSTDRNILTKDEIEDINRRLKIIESRKEKNVKVLKNLTIKTSGATNTYDPQIVFNIGGTDKFTLGVDDSVSGDPLIVASGSALGTNDRMSLDSSGNLGIGGTDLKIDYDGTGVLLKNDSGILKIRNLADGADAIINAKHLRVSSNSTTTGEDGDIGYNTTTDVFTLAGIGLSLDSSTTYTTSTMGDGNEKGSSIIALANNGDVAFKLYNHANALWYIGGDASAATTSGGSQQQHDLLIGTAGAVGDNVKLKLDHAADDANAVLSLFYNSTNYATLTTAANGATTIATVDSDGVAGDLTLQPDGDIILDATANGTVTIKDSVPSISVPALKIDNDYDSTTASSFSFNKLRANPSTSDEIAQFLFYANTDNGLGVLTKRLYASIKSTVVSFHPLTWEGDIQFSVNGGSPGSTSHLALTILFNFLKPAVPLWMDGQSIRLEPTQGLYFDTDTSTGAAGHTYIYESADDVLRIIVGGDIMLQLDESTDSGVTSLQGTLKIAEQADASADTAGYGQLWVKSSDPNELMFTDDGGNDIPISNMIRHVYMKHSYRLSSVNNWYTGFFLHMGTSVAAADFTTSHYLGLIFNANAACHIKAFSGTISVSSTEPYVMAFWDVAFADGNASADSATIIGAEIALNGGSNLTTSRWYNFKKEVNYDLAAGHNIFLVAKYTDGSGNKTFNWTCTTEIIETS